MFEVKINGGNHRVNTGAIEKVLEATFAEVLGEDVHVWVTQTDDHTLAVELDRTVEDRKAALAAATGFDPYAEGAEATAQADALMDEAEKIIQDRCPNALLPDGPICPACGGERAPSGCDGGSWVHLGR